MWMQRWQKGWWKEKITSMINIIKHHLLQIVDNINAGNSELSDEEAMKLIESISALTSSNRRLSKYEACRYLNISRATFDNYVREGKLPKGAKEPGFKELSWKRKDLDRFVEEYRNK